MRIYFQNGSIPTRAAKRLKAQQGVKESESRRVTALVLGYRNWADLENTLNTAPASPLDEECDGATLRQRRVYQAQQLQQSGIDLQGHSVEDVIAQWQPSAARPQTPVAPKQANAEFQPRAFLEALLILQKLRNAPIEPYADVLLEGIRHATTPSWLRAAGILASDLLDGTRERAPELARRMLEALAEKGDAHAIFNLSTSLMLGDGGPKDEKRAADILENLVNAADTPDDVRAMAQSRLGGVYAQGMRRGTDAVKALQLWERAAEGGDAEAGFNAGLFHDNGTGVPENAERAAYFYRLAAEAGHVYASTNLGLLLLNRPDLSTNFEEAESRLAFSARKGDAHAVEAMKVFDRQIDMAMRDFDSGRIRPEEFRGANEKIRDLAQGKPMSEVFKDHAPKKTVPRSRSSKRK